MCQGRVEDYYYYLSELNWKHTQLPLPFLRFSNLWHISILLQDAEVSVEALLLLTGWVCGLWYKQQNRTVSQFIFENMMLKLKSP